MKKLISLVLILILALSAAACGPHIAEPPTPGPPDKKPNDNQIIIEDTDMVMFDNKTTDYKIVLPASPTASDKKAEEELKLFFCEATGITLDTLSDEELTFSESDRYISIGGTTLLTEAGITPDKTKLGRDGYLIKTVGNTVFMTGATGNGTVFSVYRFLSAMFGYRYYAKDEISLEKKDRGNLKDFDVIERPSIDSRNIDVYELYTDEEYLTRMRLTPAMGRNYDYFTQGWSTLNDQSMAHQILPYDVYKDREGCEDWYSGDFFNGQLNITKAYYDETMFNEFVNNLINNYIAIETDSKYFMLGINDNNKNWRMEPNIGDYDKYKASGVMARFINKVSDKVQEWIDLNDPDREIYLVMFAYVYTAEPPVIYDSNSNTYKPIDESVVLNDNVMVRIAPIRSQNSYPHTDSKVNPEAAMAFAGWGAVAKNLAVWDYGTNFSAYLAPYPDWGTLQENFLMYREKGVQDILTQLPAHTAGTSLHDYKIFMRSELMWNVDADFRTLHNDFFANYYRQAAPAMQEYFDYLVTVFANKDSLYKGQLYYTGIYTSSYWDYENILQMERLIGKAKDAIEAVKDTDPVAYAKVSARLREESLFYQFVLVEAFSQYYGANTVEAMINSFETDAAEAGLIAISNQTYITSGGRTDKDLLVNVIKRWRESLATR